MAIIKNAFGEKSFAVQYRGETIFCAHVMPDSGLQVASKGGHALEPHEVLAFQKWLNEVYYTST